MQARTLGGARRRGLADSARFLKTLVAAPRLTGAVAPSGRALARAMAAAIGSPSQGLVVELGPGTGPVTQALIETRVAPERLVLVEYDPGFCRMLEARFDARPRHPGRRLRLAPHARALRGPADRRRGLQPAAAQPAAASPHETDRRRLRADGACGGVRAVHLWPSVAYSARVLRQSLFRRSLEADPAQSAAGLCVDLSARYERAPPPRAR